MNTSGDAAEQVVRLSLEGMEVAAKITGSAAKEVAALLYAALKNRDKNKIKGRQRLTSMLRSGKELTIFTVKNKDMARFVADAKRYGVVYCVLREAKDNPHGVSEIMVRAEDAAKINRIVENIKIATVSDPEVIRENAETGRDKNKDAAGQTAPEQERPQKSEDDRLLDEMMAAPAQKQEATQENPTAARAEKSRPSEPSSKSRKMANFDDLFTTPTATETQSDRPQLTKEEYAAKKKAERDSLYALADEMAQEVMRDGEAFRGFLDVQARFDRYSATNALLIYAQNDEATRLRDFDGWKERGIYVRKNETGISILEAGDSYVTEDGRTGYYYNVKKVFDISQTDAKRQRQPQVHYDDRLLLSALIAKRPVPIEMADSVQNGAVYDYERKTIFVQRGMDGQDLFRSVSLALARAEMAQQENSTPQADAFKSYCVSYMLCRKYGVDTQGYDFSRLPDELKNAEPQTIRGELTDIRDTLQTMTGKMVRTLEQSRTAAQKETGKER